MCVELYADSEAAVGKADIGSAGDELVNDMAGAGGSGDRSKEAIVPRSSLA